MAILSTLVASLDTRQAVNHTISVINNEAFAHKNAHPVENGGVIIDLSPEGQRHLDALTNQGPASGIIAMIELNEVMNNAKANASLIGNIMRHESRLLAIL